MASKLQSVTLDNASANGTMCDTIQQLHESRDMVWNTGKNQLMYVIVLPLYLIHSFLSPGVSHMWSTSEILT
jgi:hypothetical protein